MPSRTVPLLNRLREQRERAGISQRELARRTGLDQAQISKWERGLHALSLVTAVRMARVLECHAEELAGDVAA